MRRLIQATWVIARRDYVTTVWSSSFLVFLIGPLFPILAGVLLGTTTTMSARGPDERMDIALIGSGAPVTAIRAAADRLRDRLGEEAMPQTRIVAPEGDPARQATRLLGSYRAHVQGVLVGGLERPVLYASQAPLDTMMGPLSLAVDMARTDTALGRDLPSVAVGRQTVLRTPDQVFRQRVGLARAGQLVVMMLVVLLSGMLVSNLVEEKSNKVIEVLAAAVPVDAIFAGKLMAMLAMSFTGIIVWASTGLAAAMLLLPEGLGSVTEPGVGWPAYIVLAAIYFAMSYLLVGGLLLGIGSQASTAREVQTLSMPLTMGQLLIFGFAVAGISHPHDLLARSAAIFPLSSPLMMLARAAEFEPWWPHLVGIAWQMLWLLLVVRVSARIFRRSVLSTPAQGDTLLGMLKAAFARTT